MVSWIVRAAHEQAAAAGDDWVGPWHVVLALLGGDSLAARVLNEAGLDRERALELLPRHGRPGHHRGGGFANPAFHRLSGIATGLALAEGERAPSPEHWLIALAHDAEVERGRRRCTRSGCRRRRCWRRCGATGCGCRRWTRPSTCPGGAGTRSWCPPPGCRPCSTG
ncbi:Clp protease N-terminal domain-containing protein [Nonomuraea thailandensis]